MKKAQLKSLTFVILTYFSFQILHCQNSISINGENIKVSKFLVYETGTWLNRMEYDSEENWNLSPFFGQKGAINLGNGTECEIAYKRLGYLCSTAKSGKYKIDFASPKEFLPLFWSSKSEDSWDNLVFDYFTNHVDGISAEFLEKWNSAKTNVEKRKLLSLPENKVNRETFYRNFIDEKSVAEYKKKTKKEVDFTAKIEAAIETELSDYLKAQSVSKKTADKIKSDTKVNIQKKINSSNIIEIKYFSIGLNGTFLGIVNDYAKIICNKITSKEKLTSFEQKFYDEYMKLEDVFLISHMQYIHYKVDKTRISNLISEISQEIDATLKKENVQSISAQFTANVNLKIKKDITEDFKSDGGFVMQIAESGQFAQMDEDCTN